MQISGIVQVECPSTLCWIFDVNICFSIESHDLMELMEKNKNKTQNIVLEMMKIILF